MINMARIDEIVTRLTDALPPGAERVRDEAEARFKSVLKAAFERMDLVSREEFEEQKAKLAAAEARLQALQQQLAADND